MLRPIITTFFLIVIFSCSQKNTDDKKADKIPITGTWKLLNATLVEKGDTTVTDYTGKVSFIKIINETHFAFLQHDLNQGKDSGAVFVAGGGRYSISDSSYTEQLEYCSAREWEGHEFTFTVKIKDDTLVQHGIEKVESAGVDRLNTETYVRVKKAAVEQ